MTTHEGLKVVDLDPQSAELWVVAVPPDYDGPIDPDALPPGARWVDEEEWAALFGS